MPADLVLVGEFEVRGRVAKLPVWTLAAESPDAREGDRTSGAQAGEAPNTTPEESAAPAPGGAQAGSGR